MNDLLLRLEFKNESLDAAIYKPIDSRDLMLIDELNSISGIENLGFNIEVIDVFGETFRPPLSLDSIETVCFRKIKIPETSFFFSQEGLIKNLDSGDIARSSQIYLAGSFKEFKTLSCDFRSWDFFLPETEQRQDGAERVDARKFVRDFGGRLIHQEHLFWIKPFTSEPLDCFSEKWLEIATPKAAILLFSEVVERDGDLLLVIKGNKNLEFVYTPTHNKISLDQCQAIHKALNWVFEAPREAEIKHTLLFQRLSGEEVKSNDDWFSFLSRASSAALNSAKDDYKNHINIKTGDLLKAVTDIRKTVSDETNKIIEKSQGLTSGLLRDMSITIMIAGLRQTLISKNILTAEAAAFLVMATISWLTVNSYLTGYQNKLFIRSQIRFRRNWSKGLSSLITPGELNKISKRPFREAVKSYKSIRTRVNYIYAVMILLLVYVLLFKW